MPGIMLQPENEPHSTTAVTAARNRDIPPPKIETDPSTNSLKSEKRSEEGVTDWRRRISSTPSARRLSHAAGIVHGLRLRRSHHRIFQVAAEHRQVAAPPDRPRQRQAHPRVR